jgi:hypothetical protein
MASGRQKLLTGLGRLNPWLEHRFNTCGGVKTVSVLLRRPPQNDSRAVVTGAFVKNAQL